jgi:hypothetical protein
MFMVRSKPLWLLFIWLTAAAACLLVLKFTDVWSHLDETSLTD